MSKQIPAPLIVGRVPRDEEPDTCLIGAKGLFFARVVGGPMIDAEQVARLFAAAPELLAACEAVLGMRIVCPEDAATELEQCRAAIAKAKGQAT